MTRARNQKAIELEKARGGCYGLSSAIVEAFVPRSVNAETGEVPTIQTEGPLHLRRDLVELVLNTAWPHRFQR